MDNGQYTAVYTRVSSRQQDHASQLPDLRRWAEANSDQSVRWYRDQCTGKSMNRPAWNRLERDLRTGKVSRIVVWRLDRLGRTAKGLTALFEELTVRKVPLTSLRDGLDLFTAAGRLMGNVLASVAQYETEIRAERVKAGQEAAKRRGVRWGGSEAGRRIRVTDAQVSIIRTMKQAGKPITEIASATGLSRPSVYRTLKHNPVP